jgi:hypothetical protein
MEDTIRVFISYVAYDNKGGVVKGSRFCKVFKDTTYDEISADLENNAVEKFGEQYRNKVVITQFNEVSKKLWNRLFPYNLV